MATTTSPTQKKRKPNFNFNPTFDEIPTDPGDHGVMASYRSFNLSPGADALMELLEALYLFIDTYYKDSYPGYIVFEKLMIPVCDFLDIDDCVSEGEHRWLSKFIEQVSWMFPQLLDAMECQYVTINQNLQNPFKQFRKPGIVGLTRAGFIKFIIVNYLDMLVKPDRRLYDGLIYITQKFRLVVPGTNRPVMPLHDKRQVDKNFTDLSMELQIPLDRIRTNLRNLNFIPPSKISLSDPAYSYPFPPEVATTTTTAATTGGRPGPPTRAMSTEQAISQHRRKDIFNSAYRGSPSPTRELDRELERELEMLRVKEQQSARFRFTSDPPLTSMSPPSPPLPQQKQQQKQQQQQYAQQHHGRKGSRMAAKMEEEERLAAEIRAAERELRDMEEHYGRLAGERDWRRDMESIEHKKKKIDRQLRSMEQQQQQSRGGGILQEGESSSRRGVGAQRDKGDPYYWEPEHRYRYYSEK
ncbi:hypothetical protein AA313_de0204633 [Arthrobotrys entomopaga]|nr:hypothetical protein AA313_de0204633 [Arthrobotrys entomopaga]